MPPTVATLTKSHARPPLVCLSKSCMRRYALLTASYRFLQKPKKK